MSKKNNRVPILCVFQFLCAGLLALMCLWACSEDKGSSETNDAEGNPWPGDLNVDCGALPSGPFTVEPFIEGLGTSEDLAFDGQGSFVAMGKEGKLAKVDADGTIELLTFEEALTTGGGLRYLADGRLLMARLFDGTVVQLFTTGEIRTFASGLEGPNAIHPDLEGNVWVSESTGGQVSRIKADGSVDVVVSGDLSAGANGVVYDERRKSLFFAAGLNESGLRIGRIDFDDSGTPGKPVLVTGIENASGDGIALDACGHLYIIDNAGAAAESDAGNASARAKLRRLRLDATGDLVSSEIVAEFDDFVTNQQWASGEGFDPTHMYVLGFTGKVYRVDVGILGAPVPIPDFSKQPPVPAEDDGGDTDGDVCVVKVTVNYDGPVQASLNGAAMEDHEASEMPLGFFQEPVPTFPVASEITGLDDGQHFTIYVRLDQEPTDFVTTSPGDLLGRSEYFDLDCSAPPSVVLNLQDTYGACPGEAGKNAVDENSACSGAEEICRDLTAEGIAANVCAAECTTDQECAQATINGTTAGQCRALGAASMCVLPCESDPDCPNAGSICDTSLGAGLCVFEN